MSELRFELRTLRLAPLVVHVQRSSPVHPRHHLEVGAVEAVHSYHAGLGVEVAFIRVCCIQIVLKYSQSIQVLNLKYNEAIMQRNENVVLGLRSEMLTFLAKQLMVHD